MSKKPKKKLCWNCEGNVSFETENCPFCGVYLSPLGNDEGKDSLFAPPYRIEETEEEPQVPTAPYVQEQTVREEVIPLNTKEVIDEKQSALQAILVPLILMLSGSVFLLFGLALFLFSHNGVFTLSWDASGWYLYLLLGLPILAYGCHTLMKLKDS